MNSDKKMWSINIFSKGTDGSYSIDMYQPRYRWSYDAYDSASKSFNKIPETEDKSSKCELMEYNFETRELKCIQEKYFNHFASQYIIQGKYQDEIK